MTPPILDPTDRRGFLARIARSLGFASMGAFAVAQEMKRRRLANDPECLRFNPCRDCSEFTGCSKPKAREARGSGNPT
jgi:hypothetical protein